MFGPIVAALLPAVPGLINLVEGLFRSKDNAKTGDTKMDAVVLALRGVLEKMVATGQIVGQPSDDALRALTETVLTQMRASGQLGASLPASIGGVAARPGPHLYLVRGDVTELAAVE